MITKYKQFNESIKSLLIGPTKEQVWGSIGYGHSFDTPEEFLKYIFTDLDITRKNKLVTYKRNHMTIFEIELEYDTLSIDIKYWDILSKIFNLNYTERVDVIIKTVKKYLNIDVKYVKGNKF